MKCPKCKDAQLTESRVKGRDLKVDHCATCKGMWFDENELASVLSVPATDLKVPADARAGTGLCPKCSDPLYVFCYPGTLTLIDMCRKCEGIWLDDRELREINSVRKTLEKESASKNKITCPKCGFAQPESDECVRCGIIFSKYDAQKKAKKVETRKIFTKPQQPEKDDSVSGLKGSMLNFVNNAIETLMGY